MKPFRSLPYALIIMVLMAAGPVLSFEFSEIEKQIVEYKLDNGLTIIILPRHDAPVVSCVTHVDAGCVDDPMGSMGMAHMFEHMAFKGTREIGTTDIKKELKWIDEEDRIFELILAERAKGELADSALLASLDKQLAAAADSSDQYVITNEFGQIVESEGGIGMNAGTSYDNTVYYINYPSNRLELWMAMESDRFANPVLRQLYKEKQVIAEERRFRVTSSPTGKLFLNEFLGLAFNSHPYGKCMVGEMEEIQNYNRPVMRRQLSSHYVPRNMAIAIVGDVNPDEVIRLAKKYFGRLEDHPKPRPVMITEEAPFGVRTSTIYENSQPMFIMGYRIPPAVDPDYTALSALASYLGSGRTSALYKNLVKDKKSAVEASAFTGFPGEKFETLFGVFCIPSNDFTNAENESMILSEIEKVRTEPIPDSELEKIKAKAKSGLINALASNSGMAAQLADYYFTKGDWRELFKEIDRVNALTADDLKKAAEKYLDPDKRVVAYLEKPVEDKSN
ncbi:MAG: peptidase M16 [candidate division Zixibacteria bacterium HGW-Zixibacteria-1]|nr:MAG: peptidase M16 [candidate division Zixibacteria bacterium HGW-Zixibacteria-1]